MSDHEKESTLTVKVWKVVRHLHCPYCGRAAPRVVETETYWCPHCDVMARFPDGETSAVWERGR